MNPFSYTEYRNIITLVRQHLPIKDFAEVLFSPGRGTRFCVLSHDIEFSIDRALILARIENHLEVSSTYTVQLRNNTYNALSQKNIEAIQEIKKLGQRIEYESVFPPKTLDGMEKSIREFDVIQKNSVSP